MREHASTVTFFVGFALFSAALAGYSWRVALGVDGVILMALAVYPYLARRGTPHESA
jgi:hypothetical protein